MYKIETHLHTSEVSRCGQIRAHDMVKRYREAGYSTLFVTDHFQPNTLDTLGDIPWEEKTSIFLSGYYRAKAAGDELGITVLPGAELTFPASPNHYLVYGITKAFLDAYPQLHKKSVEEFFAITRSHGLLVVQAHPYRDESCCPTPEYADAFEVYNSNPRHNDYNYKAAACAGAHGLPGTAGSDAHRAEDVALSGVLSPYPIQSPEDYARLIKSGAVELLKEDRA